MPYAPSAAINHTSYIDTTADHYVNHVLTYIVRGDQLIAEHNGLLMRMGCLRVDEIVKRQTELGES
jgi:hypothetical protein